MRSIVLLLAVASLCSCSARTRVMHNMSIPAHEEPIRIKVDHGYCLQVANGAAPMPQLRYAPLGGQTTTGYFNAYSQGRTVFGNYSSTTYGNPADSFMAGMANAAAIDSMLSNKRAQQDIYEGCMARLGWVDGERPSANLNAATNEADLHEATPVKELEWEYLSESESQGYRSFGSPDAVLVDGDHRIFQVLHKMGGNEAAATVHIGDCSQKTIAITEVISMDLNTGKELLHMRYKPEEIESIKPEPGTVQEIWLNFACSQN